ncbi:MAG: phosphoheptose isomerase [uncultured bacterium]|nr:MAG: phosphoheptose isomerase [uncultured bacterium]
MKEYIQKQIKDSISAKEAMLKPDFMDVISKIADSIVESLKNKNKLILFGNGGSASDAQHIAAELVGRFESERRGLPAISLTVNTSNLTAIGNDYGFENVYSRQIEALAAKGDAAIGISTSGNSKNVIIALKRAKELGIKTIGFTGIEKCQMDDICDIVLHIPVKVTARIQECHILAGHIICGIIDKKMSF